MKQNVGLLCYGRWCVLPTRLQTVDCTWEIANNGKCYFFFEKSKCFLHAQDVLNTGVKTSNLVVGIMLVWLYS